MKKTLQTIFVVLLAVATVLTCVYMYPLFTGSSTPTSGSLDTAATVTKPTTSTTTTAATIASTRPTITADPERAGFAFTKEQESRLNTMLQNYGGSVAFVLEDLHSGYVYAYNADADFFAASILKAPYCMYLLDLASQGKCDLNQTIPYTADIQSNGTGKVKESPYGTQFTVSQLIEYAIRYSDNAALRMLRELYPASGFVEYSESLGLKNAKSVDNITGGHITAADASVYMRAIYLFIQNNEQYGALLRQYMTSTTNPMFTSSSYDVIRKYGWATNSFHDTAIIDAPYPYTIVLLTDHADGKPEDYAMFRQISATVEGFSAQKTE